MFFIVQNSPLITHVGTQNLNLILLAVTTNGLIFQIIDSLIESIGVRLT